ncbi:MAG: hypothetical protein L0228_16565 [Planctomycetes bacterium]|nr:hypothetical protein [Planctomycetota bacterium]
MIRLTPEQSMMKTSRLSAALTTSFGLLLAISAASPDCWAQQRFFDGGPSGTGTDFHDPVNWSDDMVPSAGFRYIIQDNKTATFSSGSTSVIGLTVSNDSFGRLRMTGGSLTTLNTIEPLEVGRERFPRGKQGDYNNNGFVDAADYVIWRKTLGQSVLNPGDGADGDESEIIDQGDYDFWRARFGLVTKGGEVIMTGSSTLTTNGAVIGRRTKGLLSVGPMAVVDVKGPINNFSEVVRRKDLEVGAYGPAYIAITTEPGLEADGLAIIEGTVNANSLIVNVFGSKGEVRVLPGGRLKLNGALVLSHCDTQFFPSGCGLVANPQPLMSSKLSIIGSGGTIEVGRHDPDLSPPPGHDPLIRRDFRSEFPADATLSFTADAGGVTPIVLVDNSIAFPAELTGTAYLDGTVGNVPGSYAGINLELNLDAYTGSSPLTLIDAPPDLPGAPPPHLVGVFGSVTFLGSRTATVNYDYLNGDVFLSNFQGGAGAGSLAVSTVPEPSGLTMMTLTLGILLCSHSLRVRIGSRPGWHRLRTARETP